MSDQLLVDYGLRAEGAMTKALKRKYHLTTSDWEQLTEWVRQEVPISTLEAAIAVAAGRAAAEGQRVSSLRYCTRALAEAQRAREVKRAAQPVQLQFEMAAGPDPQVAVFLSRLRTALSEVYQREARPERASAPERALSLLEAIAALKQVPADCPDLLALEERLIPIERLLLDRLLQDLAAAELKELELAADEQLRPYRYRWTPEALAGQRERFLDQRVRERYGLPSFSPFGGSPFGGS